jgi:hypothetical protein
MQTLQATTLAGRATVLPQGGETWRRFARQMRGPVLRIGDQGYERQCGLSLAPPTDGVRIRVARGFGKFQP